MKYHFSIFILFIFTFQASAQLAPEITHVPWSTLDTLHSDIIDDDYYLLITLPPYYLFEKEEYPVFYYLDAFGTSGSMNELGMRNMVGHNTEDFIMVGISYKVNPFLYGEKRMRDYMPQEDDEDTEHRGEDFIDFIKTELIPFIDNKYRTNAHDRGLIGYSLSGLLATWTIKQEPGLFNRLGIISPSLWFKDELLFKDEEFLKNIAGIEDLRVFTAAGSLESENMISYPERLANILKTNDKIEVSHFIFEGETHGTVGHPSNQRAMRFLYRNEYNHMIGLADKAYNDGDFESSRDQLLMAIESYPDRVTIGVRYNLACMYALTGDKDNSFDLLDQVVEDDYSNLNHISSDKDFNSLHDDPRWNEVLLKVKENMIKKE